MSERKIFYLHELDDYKVASGYPDVRGWTVKGSGGQVVGKVDNLLVNKETERVVYLDVELDEAIIKGGDVAQDKPADEGVHGFTNKEGENHLIVPIGLVRLLEDDEIVQTDKINYDTFHSAQRKGKHSSIEPGYEMIVYKHLTGKPDDIHTDDMKDFYDRPEFKRHDEV